MNNAAIQAARVELSKLPKAEVFAKYVRECCPRINSAASAELRKSWMVYDILVARFGRKAVEGCFA